MTGAVATLGEASYSTYDNGSLPDYVSIGQLDYLPKGGYIEGKLAIFVRHGRPSFRALETPGFGRRDIPEGQKINVFLSFGCCGLAFLIGLIIHLLIRCCLTMCCYPTQFFEKKHEASESLIDILRRESAHEIYPPPKTTDPDNDWDDFDDGSPPVSISRLSRPSLTKHHRSRLSGSRNSRSKKTSQASQVSQVSQASKASQASQASKATQVIKISQQSKRTSRKEGKSSRSKKSKRSSVKRSSKV